MVGNDAQHGAAVVAADADRSAAGGDQRDEQIDQAHEQAAEDAGLSRIGGNAIRFLHAAGADHVDHDNSEGKTGQGVQGVVALQKAPEERTAGGGVGRLRRHAACAGDGIGQGGDDQNGQKNQEDWIQKFPDPGHDSPGLQGEQQYDGKKQQGKHGQIYGVVAFRQQIDGAHGKRGAGAPGNGEQRSDGQIEQRAEKPAVSAADPPGQLVHALAAAQAQGHHRQHGDAYGGHEYPEKGAPHLAAGVQTQLRGKDQVACAEKHAEEHTGDCDGFFPGEITFHGEHPFSRP